MQITTYQDDTGYAPQNCRWHAVDSDSFDGAPDTHPPSSVGYGATPAEAIRDLIEIMEDCGEITSAEAARLLKGMD